MVHYMANTLINKIVMEETLENATEITCTQYVDLVNPKFIGQTRVNSNGTYWVLVKESNVLYKIQLTF